MASYFPNGRARIVYRLALAAVVALGLGTSAARADLVIDITTAEGAGKDAHVRGGSASANLNFGSAPILQVKKGLTLDETRRAWLGFDLSSIPHNATITDATLTLTIVPTGIGTTSLVGTTPPRPKVWSFELWGLTKQSLDNWNENTITWNNAPANMNSLITPFTNDAMMLGSFTVNGAGILGDTVTVETDALTAFLNDDTNDFATLMVRRATTEVAVSNTVVHGFASGEYPDPTFAPTLEVTVALPGPEPSTLALAGIGLAGLLGYRRLTRSVPKN